MQIDVNQTLEFRASPLRMFGMAIVLLGLGALCLVLGLRLLPNIAPGSFKQFVGWAGTIIFGTAFLLFVWQSFNMKQRTLTLSPQGFRHTHISTEFVPWPAVESLSVRPIQRARTLVVKVPEALWSSLSLRPMVRWNRPANKSYGVDGLVVSTMEFSVKFDDLFELFTAYCKAHGGKAD